MFGRKIRIARANCDHAHVVTVRNAGIERRVCEACGHVSLRAHEELSGSAAREQFERDIERPRQPIS